MQGAAEGQGFDRPRQVLYLQRGEAVLSLCIANLSSCPIKNEALAAFKGTCAHQAASLTSQM